MPLSGVEIIGRSLDPTSVTRQYYLHGPADEDEVYAFISGLPAVIAGFPKSDHSAEEEDEIAGDWRAQVRWGSTPAEQPLNTVEYRFNFTAPSAHIKQSLETKLYSTPTGSAASPGAPVNAPFFGGAINVVIDGGKKRVEGIDLAPPPETFVLTFVTETGFVTREYQQKVERLCGHVNDDEFYDCDAGSLLLARVSGGKSAEDVWSIEFGFSFISNEDNIPVGDINVAEKDGHDLLWVFYGDVDDENYYDVVPRPKAAYVEKVWPRAIFSGPLGLDFPI